MDKLIHLLAGFVIATSARSLGVSKAVTFGFTASVGVAKEVYDAQGHGTPEVLDALATAAGGVLGALAVDPNDQQRYRVLHGAVPWSPNAFALAQVDSVARCVHVPVQPLTWSLAGPAATRYDGYSIKRHIVLADTLSAPMIRHEATHALTGVLHGDVRETAVFTARCNNWPAR